MSASDHRCGPRLQSNPFKGNEIAMLLPLNDNNFGPAAVSNHYFPSLTAALGNKAKAKQTSSMVLTG